MRNIKLNDNLISKFFDGMDSECLEEVSDLVKQGAVLNLKDGNLYLGNTNQHIGTDYFSSAFYLDEDEKPYQVGSEKLVVATRKNPYGDDYQYICIEESPLGSDGWDLAMSWDPNSKECYGTDCRVFQLRIETFDGEWEEFPIWFESREDATIYFNE